MGASTLLPARPASRPASQPASRGSKPVVGSAPEAVHVAAVLVHHLIVPPHSIPGCGAGPSRAEHGLEDSARFTILWAVVAPARTEALAKNEVHIVAGRGKRHVSIEGTPNDAPAAMAHRSGGSPPEQPPYW